MSERWLAALVLCLGTLWGPVSTSVRAADEPSGDREERVKLDQEPRSAHWRSLRSEKAGRLEPEKLPAGEAVFLWVEEQVGSTFAPPALFDVATLLGFEQTRMIDVIGLDYKDHLYPQFGTVRSGSGLGPGLRYRDPRIGQLGIGFELSAAATLKRYQSYQFQFGRMPWSRFVPEISTGGLREEKTDYFLFLDLRYEYLPDEDFFGLGSDSREGNRTDFLQEHLLYNLVGGIQASEDVTFAFRGGFSQRGTGPGGDDRFPNSDILFSEDDTPGLFTREDYFEVGASATFDFRDVPGNPHKGAFVGFTFERFDDVRQSRFEFNRFGLDTRAYVPLGSPQRVLALRFMSSMDDADGGAQIPFYLQRALGGSATLRGHRLWRFRGEDLLYLSAEYRWESAEYLEFAVFYDTGRVFSEEQAYRFEGLEKSIGVGVRFKTRDSVPLRFDIGRSEEGTRFSFTFDQAF